MNDWYLREQFKTLKNIAKHYGKEAQLERIIQAGAEAKIMTNQIRYLFGIGDLLCKEDINDKINAVMIINILSDIRQAEENC